MSTAEHIRKYIEQQGLGEPFTPAVLLQFGTRKAIDLELARLVKGGLLMRVARGVYVRPKPSKYLAFVPPEPFKVAMAKAGGQLEVHGAEAARRFGLSTQVPVRPVYCTTGSSRHIQFGGIPITIKHVSPRKLVAPGTNVGLAISALWYLGRHEVEPKTFEAIRKKLSESEYAQLKASLPMMPAWMAETMMRYERELQNG